MENQEKPQGRSNPGTESTPNPAKHFIQWKSKNAQFSYYDKETKEDVLLKAPFSFIPLYVCSTIKGYNHKKNKTYIANEVKNITTDVMTITSYNSVTKDKKVEHKGLYADIKDDFDQNIKFTVSLYAGIKGEDKKLKLVNLQLNGAGLHHWFEFIKHNDIWKNAVKVSKTTNEKNGDVTYKAPVYESMPISKEMDIEAGVLQNQITEYLTEYFAKNGNSTTSNETQDNGLNSKPKADSKWPAKKASKKVEEVEEEDNDISNESIEDDDDDSAPF